MGFLKVVIALACLWGAAEAKVVRRWPSAWEDPWNEPSKPKPKAKLSLATKAIRFHQIFISPAQGPRSGFYPTSSQYTLLAMQHYGFLKGYIMGCSRLTRENSDPWVYNTIKIGSSTRKQDNPY